MLLGLAVSGFLVASALLPLVERLAIAIGAVDEGGYRRVHERPTPQLGGLVLVIPLLLVCLWIWSGHVADLFFTGGVHERAYFWMAVCALAISVIGIWDDTRGMTAKVKLAGQVFVASVWVAFADHGLLETLSLTFLGTYDLEPTTAFVVEVAWIVGLINAVNLIDGLDGLATGVGIITCLTIGSLAAHTGALEPLLVCLVLAGAMLAFLRYNLHPARMFLGDTGSMLLGFALATLSVMSGAKSATVVVFAPLFALGLPILEVLVSVSRRFARGQPLFAADRLHTHHRLLEKGYSIRQAVLVMYAAAAVMALCAWLYILFPSNSPFVVVPLVGFAVTVAVILYMAGYFPQERPAALISRRRRNLALNALSRYVAISLGECTSPDRLRHLLLVCLHGARLDYLGLWIDGNTGFVARRKGGGEHFSTGVAPPPEPGEEGMLGFHLEPPGGQALTLRYRPAAAAPDTNDQEDLTRFLANAFRQPPCLPESSPPDSG